MNVSDNEWKTIESALCLNVGFCDDRIASITYRSKSAKVNELGRWETAIKTIEDHRSSIESLIDKIRRHLSGSESSV